MDKSIRATPLITSVAAEIQTIFFINMTSAETKETNQNLTLSVKGDGTQR